MKKEQIVNLSDMQLEYHISKISKEIGEASMSGKDTKGLHKTLESFLMEDYRRKNAE